MGKELYLNKGAFEFEINAIKYSAEGLDTDVKQPAPGGNMPALSQMLKTYAEIITATECFRNMLLETAENIRATAETISQTDSSLFSQNSGK